MVKSDIILRQLRLLSQRAAKTQPFLKETACLSEEIRVIIGYIRAYSELFKDESLNEFVKPLQFIGLASWSRTELSDLGFMIGYDTKQSSEEELLAELTQSGE